MRSEDFMIYLAIVVTFISAASLGFSYYSISSFESVTGFVVTNTSIATVNITVSPSVVINFTVNNINWGSGSLSAGTTQAQLESNGTGLNAVINGTWSQPNNPYLVLQNIGTENVTLQLMASKNATQFINGTSPGYQYSVINNGAGSCSAANGFPLGQWYDVNTTYPGNGVCNVSGFGFATNLNMVNISIRLVIPVNSLNGSLGDTITATATGA